MNQSMLHPSCPADRIKTPEADAEVAEVWRIPPESSAPFRSLRLRFGADGFLRITGKRCTWEGTDPV